MFIRFLKDIDGNITGFLSHIPKNKLKNHPPDEIREIPDRDYPILFYYLVGKQNVQEKKGIGCVKIGGIELKDEGDFDKNCLKVQKEVFSKKNHILNQNI